MTTKQKAPAAPEAVPAPEGESPVVQTTSLLAEVLARATAESVRAEREVAEALAPILTRVDAIAAEVEALLPESQLAALRPLKALLDRPDLPFTPTLHKLRGKVGDVLGIRAGVRPQVDKLRGDAARPPATLEHRGRWQQEQTEKARQLWGAPAAVQRLLGEITDLCVSLNARGADAIVPVPSAVEPPEPRRVESHRVTSTYVPLART